MKIQYARMKRLNSILLTVLLIIAGCGGQKKAINDDLIIVDVTKSYSSKKELTLQDFMDVEYIVLETNDEFVNQGLVEAIGEIIIVRNRIRDGEIFIYDRTGKALRKINRRGQKLSEEYTSIYNITLDEDNGEIFINDIFIRKFLVYDLYGNFRRSFSHKEDIDMIGYRDIFNYSIDNLICFDEHNKEVPFVLISKQDGSIIKEIKIPFKEKKFLEQRRIDEATLTINVVSPGPYRPIIPGHNGNWILLEFSSDTIYEFLQDYSLRPIIVRTPSIQSMEKEVMLRLGLNSNRYCFMEMVKNEYNFDTRRGFPRTFMMYDKQEKEFYNYSVYNGDYSIKKEIYMNALRSVDHEIDSWQPIEAYQLVEDYKEGRLKDGKLKEIASKLDAEDNPVIMLIKHKK